MCVNMFYIYVFTLNTKYKKQMHKFVAESYMICHLCTKVSEAIVEGDYYTIINTLG